MNPHSPDRSLPIRSSRYDRTASRDRTRRAGRRRVSTCDACGRRLRTAEGPTIGDLIEAFPTGSWVKGHSSWDEVYKETLNPFEGAPEDQVIHVPCVCFTEDEELNVMAAGKDGDEYFLTPADPELGGYVTELLDAPFGDYDSPMDVPLSECQWGGYEDVFLEMSDGIRPDLTQSPRAIVQDVVDAIGQNLSNLSWSRAAIHRSVKNAPQWKPDLEDDVLHDEFLYFFEDYIDEVVMYYAGPVLGRV